LVTAIAGGRADGERSGVDEWGGDSLKSMSASRGKYFRERRIRKNAEALAVRMDMAEHNCSAKQFLESWLKVALRGYDMAKAAPWAKPLMEKQVTVNAEAMKIRLGLAQRDRNEGAQLGFGYLMRRLRKLSRGGMSQFSIEDIEAEIAKIRNASAVRERGIGPDPARKAKGKRR